MTALLKDWRDYPVGKEKYQLYLAGREWALLKEQVRARSGGVCERCRYNPGTQVHHQTYERIYKEQIEDLIHLCAPCHEFLSGKREEDPKLDVPLKWGDRIVRSVYLAGKITGTRWRNEIAPSWSTELSYEVDDWEPTPSRIPADGRRPLALTGPYWVDVEGGHGCAANNGESHACGDDHEVLREVSFSIREAIRNADMVFAWIDSPDCFGTLVEIGFASACDKLVFVASPDEFDAREMWLAQRFSDGHTCLAKSPRDAWETLIRVMTSGTAR